MTDRVRIRMKGAIAAGVFICLSVGVGIGEAGSSSADNPTHTEDVAPILMANCVTCHRPGQVAPMSLMTYTDTRPWARSIRNEVAQRNMPPWHAEAGVREYTNDRSLSDAEIDVILRWVDAGAPKGDDEHMPPLPTFSDGWQLGEPDIVVAMNEPYQIEAEGDDEYRCFVLDPQFETDQWIDVVEVLPGNRTTDHHIVLYVDQSGTIAPRLDAEEPGEGYFCFGTAGFPSYMVPGWGPGSTPTAAPAGSGYLLKAGAKLVLQMHYHKTGRPEEDLTRVGLRLARNPASKVLYNGYVLTPFLQIPPGDPNVLVAGRYRVQEDITVYSVGAHMHYLGKAMDMWAILPDNSRVDLFKVPRFDFEWQTRYTLAEPLKLPEGTMLHMEATFDNSPESPYQHSDPPRLVTFGVATTDEMAVGLFFHTRDAENLTEESDTP
jgi:mono/diheme cytochrome c family protein